MTYTLTAFMRALLILFLTLISFNIHSEQGQIASCNGIKIWHETFGDKNDPPLILVMGACCQGIIWTDEMCQKFVSEGFFVIRFDHRDAGYSTCFDFDQEPYDLLDMTKDIVGLMDHLKIQKAHFFGLSMGGMIAQIMASHFPDRVATISLISTTTDLRPLNLALAKKTQNLEALSSPQKDYLQSMDEFLNHPPTNEEEKLEERIAIWNLMNGSKIPLEDAPMRSMHSLFLSRMRYPQGPMNHMRTMTLSEKLLKDAAACIRAPTLIFHGSVDPIFPLDHGEFLAKSIPDSRLIVLDGMGHVLNPYFDVCIVKEIANFCLKTSD